MKTLDIPPQAPSGSTLVASITIPSAPFHEWVWIASRGFDRRFGAVLDGWATNLVPTLMLARTWATHLFTGTLDAQGRGQLHITIPADPALIGSRLYSRAVVLKPGLREIWTLSTLGVTEIIP